MRLQTRVSWKTGFFLTIQKDRNHHGSTGRENSCLVLPRLTQNYRRISWRKIKNIIRIFHNKAKEKILILAKSETFYL